jgi:Putative lumazine-binding
VNDKALITAVLEQYFQGHALSSASLMREVFLPSAHIEGFRGEQFFSWTLETYCEIFKDQPAPDEAERRRRVDAVDVTGSSAMAKATLEHGAVTFTDYFVLLKVDGAWKIANKVFQGVQAA